jgi:hypothetical protein
MELNIGNKRIEQLFAEFFGLDSNYIHQCYRKLKDSYNQKLSSSPVLGIEAEMDLKKGV